MAVEGKGVLFILPALNEAGKIGKVVRKVPRHLVGEILVVDDGSTDGTDKEALEAGATVIRHPRNQGVGAAIRTGIEHGFEKGFDVAVVAASDDQDEPSELPRLLDAIVRDGYDLVQGSRYMQGSRRVDHPFSRTVLTIVYSLVFRLLSGFPVTDGTNGFRAFRLSMCRELNLWQDWLNRYELEPYLYYQAIRQGYKVKEVPVTKVYPANRKIGYTKMKPFVDWWRIFRPLLLLRLGMRK